MSKNIVICCDGTNNEPVKGASTNVWRLFCASMEDAGQVKWYDAGVGTTPRMTKPSVGKFIGSLLKSVVTFQWWKAAGAIGRYIIGSKVDWDRVKDLAAGVTLRENVWDAYRYLMSVYEPGDKVFLFGFSRGAFTARVLAGMIHGVGVLKRGRENLLPYAWDAYLGLKSEVRPGRVEKLYLTLFGDLTAEEATAKAEFAKFRERVAEFKANACHQATAGFVGVWDTVSSVGMYNMNDTFPFTLNNPSVERLRHAVSIDERRAGFRTNLFTADETPQTDGAPRVKNVWFPGAHCDVGGGYEWPSESGLAMGAMEWMAKEARVAGLRVDEVRMAEYRAQCPPDSLGNAHDEIAQSCGWKFMELLPAYRFVWAKGAKEWRWRPKKPRDVVDRLADRSEGKARLHASVFERVQGDASYRPENLGPDFDMDALRSRFQEETRA